MTYRPRMVRENEAYGWLPEDEAYGRVSNVPTQQEQEDENAYSDNELAPERSFEEQKLFERVQNDPEWWSKNSGLRASFDGYNFFVKNNGELIGEYPAISGRDEYQTKEATIFQDRGPIPEGSYTLNYNDYEMYDENKAKEGGHFSWMNKPDSWGSERLAITADKNTNTYGRGGFYVHGGSTPGSNGCIDLTTYMPDFGKIVREYQEDIPLIVKYRDDFGEKK